MRRGGWRTKRATRRGWLVLVAVAAVLWFGASAVAAQDDDGLRVETETTYRVLPDEFAIEVEITYSVTNRVPNRREGFTIYRTFFRGLTEILPASATDLTATRSNGAALSIEPANFDDPELLDEDGEPRFLGWDIDFGPNLFYNQTRDFTVRYRLPDGEARDLDAWARINPAFVSFVALARGDDGLASVRIEIPEGFDVELFTDRTRPQRVVEDGMQIWTVSELEDPYDWSVVLVGSDHDGLARTPFDVDGVGSFTVASWPADDEWATWATETVEAGATFLEDAVGQEWPHDRTLLVMETVIPELAGYAGFYYEPSDPLDPRFLGIDAVVEIGEDLNTEVLNHELAHAWFNHDFSRMRWLNEGLAEYFGQLATDAAGVDDADRFPNVNPNSRDAVLLSRWSSTLGFHEDDTELYGYAASFRVISELADATGPDGLAAVIDALIDRRNPYDLELERPGALQWRRVLDTFEVVGGAEMTEELFVRWVIGDSHEDELAERRATLERRDDVAGHELGWELPLAIPELLGDWDFDDADELLADMDFLLAGQVAALDYAETVGVELPDDVEASFEAVDEPADGLDEAEAIAAQQRAAMVDLHAAQIRLAEPRGFVQRIGLRGLDPDADLAAALETFETGDYEAAVEQAEAAVELLDDADDRGADQLLEWALYAAAVLAGLVLLVVVFVFVRRRRRARAAARAADDGDDDIDDGSGDDDGDGDDADGAEPETDEVSV